MSNVSPDATVPDSGPCTCLVSYATGEEGVKAKNVGCNRLGDTPFALVELFGVLAFLP